MGSRKQTPSSAGALLTKRSIKPADHNAARVRNNQRRHRERVKNRIEHLEAKLNQTQDELAKALQTIQSLNAEVERCRQTSSCSGAAASAPPSDSTITPAALLRQPAISLKDLETLICKGCKGCNNKGNLSDGGQGPLLGCATDIQALNTEQEDESSMKPQVAGESTTSCKEAFRILAEQNYASLDTPAMRSWLEPGFRRGLSVGEGCRVSNTLLFTLLSYVSS